MSMLHFKDFLPTKVKEGNFFGNDEYETFEDLLANANKWISETETDVINVETIVLRDQNTNETCFAAEGPYCYQFIRVWYSSNS